MKKLGITDTIGGLATLKNIVVESIPEDSKESIELKEYFLTSLVNAEALLLSLSKKEFEKMLGDENDTSR